MREKHKIHETACVIKATNQVSLYVEEGFVSRQKQNLERYEWNFQKEVL